MVATSPQVPRFAALRHRNFTLLWSGLIVSNVGTWIQNVAQGWLILQLTNSPLWLGLLGLSFAIPMISLPVIGGAIADRVDRIRLLYLTQSGMAAGAIGLALLTWTGKVQAWHILVAAFLGSALLAFDSPARQALMPDLVPPRDLLNAMSLNAATYNGAALLGPALAGVLLAPLGAGSLFFINGVSFVAVLIALLLLRDVRRHGGGPQASLARSMRAGLAYAWRTRLILALLVLSSLVAVFARSYQNLLPIFARDIWQAGAQGYGILLSSAGAGAVVGAFGLASIRKAGRQGRLLVVSGVLFGLSISCFAISPSFILGVLFLFLSGLTSTVFGTIIATFLQLEAPNELRGRVLSLYSITLIGLPSLGALASGALAEGLGGLSGAPYAVLLGGLMALAIVILLGRFFWLREMKTAVGEEPRD
jgi:MFS family permease